MSNPDPDDFALFRQQFSHHPLVFVTYGAVTNDKDPVIKIHTVLC